VSTLDELAAGTFQPVLDDAHVATPAEVRRVLLCAGKIFYPLAAARDESGRTDGALVRVEQLYPFPGTELQAVLSRYSSAREVVWVQEEPANQGAWTFMRPRLADLLGPARSVEYVGREEAASPATGNYKIHQAEEAAILTHALQLPAAPSQTTSAPADEGEKATR
jgi:2-oxoglutarate dehydrogenase E1 component